MAGTLVRTPQLLQSRRTTPPRSTSKPKVAPACGMAADVFGAKPA